MFGSGDRLPFDITPTDDKLNDVAEHFQTILKRQLIDGGFVKALAGGCNTLPKYGTGFISGVHSRTKKITRLAQMPAEEGLGSENVETREVGIENVETPAFNLDNAEVEEISYKEPYWELCRTMGVYPDPDASDTQDGDGVFWESYTSAYSEEAQTWINDGFFDSVEEIVSTGKNVSSTEGAKQTDQIRGAIEMGFYTEEGHIQVLRFFGRVRRGDLVEWRQEKGELPTDDEMDEADEEYVEALRSIKEDEELPDEPERDDIFHADQDEYIEVIATIIGGKIAKISESIHSKRPIYRAVYEDEEGEMYGVGVPENNETSQKLMNGAVRLFMEGKAIALLPPKVVDRTKFVSSQKFDLYPGKTLEARKGALVDGVDKAIKTLVQDDVTDGWHVIFGMAERFSDEDTSVSKYPQGAQAKGMNKTASGLSMILGQASVPLKEVMMNIDVQWVEPSIEALVEWDIEYLEVETVAAIHGEEVAMSWQAIKANAARLGGIKGFLPWRATGTSTMMAKEVLVNKLNMFLNIIATNEKLSEMSDLRLMLEHIWDMLETGLKSPILKEEAYRKLVASRQQAMAEAMAQQGQGGGRGVPIPGNEEKMDNFGNRDGEGVM